MFVSGGGFLGLKLSHVVSGLGPPFRMEPLSMFCQWENGAQDTLLGLAQGRILVACWNPIS